VSTAAEKKRHAACRDECGLSWAEVRVLVAVLTHAKAFGELGCTTRQVHDLIAGSDEPIAHLKHVNTCLCTLKRLGLVEQDTNYGMPYGWTVTPRGERLLGASKEQAA
jgi:hypothetical protein